MTTSRPWHSAMWKRRVPAVVVAFCAVPLLTACSGGVPRVELPAKAASSTPAVFLGGLGHAARMTLRQQVVAALAGYTAALGHAEQSRSDTVARRLLRPYLADSRIGGLVQAVSAIWARGDRFYGNDVLHILGVRIDGTRAFVHDCDDTSGMGLENAATGRAVPGSAGVQHANLITRLDLVAGRWVVESQLPEDVPCVP